MLSSPLSASDAEVAAEDELSWEQNERLLNQADEDEEADAEVDVTEADPAEWTSFMPTWITSPDDLETSDDAAPASSINWSFQVNHLILLPSSWYSCLLSPLLGGVVNAHTSVNFTIPETLESLLSHTRLAESGSFLTSLPH